MTQIGLHNFEESYVIEIVIDSCYFSVIFISAINYVSIFQICLNRKYCRNIVCFSFMIGLYL